MQYSTTQVNTANNKQGRLLVVVLLWHTAALSLAGLHARLTAERGLGGGPGKPWTQAVMGSFPGSLWPTALWDFHLFSIPPPGPPKSSGDFLGAKWNLTMCVQHELLTMWKKISSDFTFTYSQIKLLCQSRQENKILKIQFVSYLKNLPQFKHLFRIGNIWAWFQSVLLK